MEIEKTNKSSEDHQADIERRVNKYEREVTYLSQKNETMSSQLKVLQKERQTYDDSVKDIKKELVEKKQLCEQLEQKLNLSEKNAKQIQEMYTKMLSDQINHEFSYQLNETLLDFLSRAILYPYVQYKQQKVEEMQRKTIQIEKYKEDIDLQRDHILRVEKERDNFKESIEILTSQIQCMKQIEQSRLTGSNLLSSNVSTAVSTSSAFEFTQQQQPKMLISGSSLAQGLDFSTSAQISSFTLQISNLKSQLEQAKKEADDHKRILLEFKNSMNEQLLKIQQQVTDRETSLLEKQGEIESLNDQNKTLKEQIEQDNIDKHDLKSNYEKVLSQSKSECLSLQSQVEKKERLISQLQEDISQIGQKNMILEDSTIPTEEDSIREITLKYNQQQKEFTAVTEKNRQLQAQLDYLQRDLKQKLPLLNLRKNEYQTMHSNYQSLKEKLALSIKNANQLLTEKTTLLEEIQKLTQIKVIFVSFIHHLTIHLTHSQSYLFGFFNFEC